MTRLTVTMPDSLHKALQDLSVRENIRIDQFVASAVGEKLSAMMTEDYLKKRAAKGSHEEFLVVLAKAPDVEPEEYDRLP